MSQPSAFVSIGFSPLDRVLGGLRRGELTLIYGAPGVGKTALTLQTSICAARLGNTTLFVDTDSNLSIERLMQMAGEDKDKILPLIFIAKPSSFHNLTLLLENLGSYVSRGVALVVVDTITSLYRAEFAAGHPFHLNRELNMQLAYLADVAKRCGLPIFMTSQVRSIPNGGGSENRIEPVATRVLKFWSQNTLRVLTPSDYRMKELVVEKASRPELVGTRLRIRLYEQGFRDVG